MFIDNIILENFRLFNYREVRLQRDFNVIIGENGTGKTTILDGIAIAVGTWFLHINSGGGKQRTIRLDDAHLNSRNVDGRDAFEPLYPVSIGAAGFLPDFTDRLVVWNRSVQRERGATRGTTAILDKYSAQADAQVRAGEAVTLPVIAYYGSGRLWLPPRTAAEKVPLTQRELSRFEGYRDALDARARAKELTRWLEYQDRIAYQAGTRSALFQAVLNAMRDMLPHASDVRFDPPRLEIVVEFQDKTVRPFSVLSDGQRSMLGLAGDLAMRMARLNPQFGGDVCRRTPGVVLIDEIDLHLHPKWQRVITELLRSTFPAVQFIATSHSPFIVQTLREGELIPLDAQPVPDVANLSIESISQGLMGVDDIDTSPRYREMVDNAKQFMETLEQARNSPQEKLEAFRRRLAERIEPYADNPAYQAILEMELAAAIGRRVDKN